MLLHRVRPDLYRTNIDIAVLGDFKEFKEEETPGFAISVLTAMMQQHFDIGHGPFAEPASPSPY